MNGLMRIGIIILLVIRNVFSRRDEKYFYLSNHAAMLDKNRCSTYSTLCTDMSTGGHEQKYKKKHDFRITSIPLQPQVNTHEYRLMKASIAVVMYPTPRALDMMI